jgi:excisionase family DNA binding protein
MPTDWVSTDEAAELSGYHPEHIRELVREGKIKAIRKGTMFWIDKASLLLFVRKATKAKAADRRHGPHPKSGG